MPLLAFSRPEVAEPPRLSGARSRRRAVAGLPYRIGMKRENTQKPYIPRVVVKMNTGTRTILSRRDKASTRRALNAALRSEW